MRHAVAAGRNVAPGALIAYILAPGEVLPARKPATPGVALASADGAGRMPVPVADEGRETAPSPIARRLAKEAGVALAAIRGTGPGGRITEDDVRAALLAPPTVAAADEAPTREVAASPLARQLASRLEIDIASVRGTGPGGRVSKEDVEAAQAGPKPSAPPERAAVGAHRPGERIPIRGMRKVIAERMYASLQEMAQLTMGMTVAMDEAVKVRSQLIDEWGAQGIRPSYTDLVVKAVAKALRAHPRLNATVGEREIELHGAINIGMAVAVPDGLLVPVIQGADRLALREIAAESTPLSNAAREGKLGLDDIAGGTHLLSDCARNERRRLLYADRQSTERGDPRGWPNPRWCCLGRRSSLQAAGNDAQPDH